MTQPTDLPENPMPAQNNTLMALNFSMYSDHERSIWSARYTPSTSKDPLGIPSGKYCLEEIPHHENQAATLRPAERLCSLPQQTHVATVYALATAGTNEQIWYEPTDGGTLHTLITQRKKLDGGEVASISAALTSALTWVHQQQMAYSELSPHRILFNSSGELKLLAPDIDLRGKPEKTADQSYCADIAAVATILWLALTGETPGEVNNRPPLKLLLPNTKPELGVTLEKAIDQKTPQPSLQEINTIIQNHFTDQPVDLFASAHPSARAELPARRPEKELHKGKNKSATQRNVIGVQKKKSKGNWIRGGVIVAVLALGGLGATEYYFSQDSTGTIANTEESSVPEQSAAEQKLPQPQVTEPRPSQSVQTPSPETTLKDLLEQRNKVLASGNQDEIIKYSAEKSPVFTQDQALIASDRSGKLATMPLTISDIEVLDTTEHQIKAQASIILTPPTGTDINTAGVPGIENKGKDLAQLVIFTLQSENGQWKMTTAEPQTRGM